MKTVNYLNIGAVVFKKNARSKRITLRVKPNSPVMVTMPQRANFKAAERVLLQHLDWVKQQQEKIKQQVQNQLLSYDSTFQVRHKPLRFAPTHKQAVYLNIDAQTIEIQVPTTWNISDQQGQSILQEAVVKALRIEGKQYLPQRTRQLAAERNISINDIRVKKVKTRWGSCSSKGNINLSLYLMLLPDALIDYVICHELAHIKHQNHSSAFWMHLEQLFPGAKALDKQLKNYRIPFS